MRPCSFMQPITVLVTVLLGWLLALPVMAADNQVQRYFQGLQSLSGDFVQQVFDADGRLLETSEGRMWMQRPGRFRWDYRTPFPQLVVADGERIWLYDQELEQVTVKPMDTAMGSTPLALLSGAAPIEEAFQVADRQRLEGLDWYRLTPRQAQPEFQALGVAFRGDRLAAIDLQDALGQVTRLTFQDLRRNTRLDPKLFDFTPPPGVDVLGDVP
ncbi:MAG: outer membrane lipoprotein chaperone LolA [Candidatus Competibacteraceae bacterium]|nr:outer membrane lipoprotein chaperone LolA [Candidatus Competibacteraceae bacterium]